MSRIIRSHIFVVNWPLFGEAWIWFRVSRITFWRHCLRKCFRFCRIEHCYCSSHTDSVGKKPDLSYFREIISRNFSRNWFHEIIYVSTRTFALYLNIIASLIMFLICTSSRDYHSLSNGHKKTNTHDIIHIELSELCECDNEIIYIRRKIMQHMCVLLTRQKL